MRYIKYLVLIFNSVLLTLISNAQSLSYLGIEKGLSNNTVAAIHKDRFGLMWFGTLDGLNRYDGYSFKVFRNKFGDTTSLPNDVITALNSDLSGNIWSGTQKGVAVLDSKTLRFSRVFYLDKQNRRSVFDKWINDIQTDGKNNMYIGSTDLGLLVCKNGALTGARIPLIGTAVDRQLSRYTVTAIQHSLGFFYILVDGIGLCSYRAGANQVVPLNVGIQGATCLKVEREGNVWIGTKHGLFLYDVKTGKCERFDLKDPVLNNSNISCLLIDERKKLWVTMNGEGLVCVTGNSRAGYHVDRPQVGSALSSDALFTIFEDELSRKWIGTLRGGIDIVDEKKNQFKTLFHDPNNPNSLVNNFTFSFCEGSDGRIWIGTDGGGLSVLDRKNNSYRNYRFNSSARGSLPGNRIPCIIMDSTRQIWLTGFGNGVSRYHPSTGTFEVIPFADKPGTYSAWKILCDSNGDIWVSALRGNKRQFDHERLFKYDKSRNAFVPAPFAVRMDIFSIIEADAQNFWVGGPDGLLLVNKKSGIVKDIDLKTEVRALYINRAGLLWIATNGRGLMSYNRSNGQFRDFTEDNGLCDNKVLNIEEDKRGNLWVSTYHGISKFDPRNLKFENFYAEDGLQSNQFYFNASAHLRTGELLFGGIKGFNIFNPDSIRQFHDFPPLIISGLRIANTPVFANSEYVADSKSFYTIDHIEVPYDKAILSLDYVALEYSLPEKIQYAYLLQGWDKSWNEVGNQRSINYSKLNGGNYTLRIRSTNASGIWNTHERVIFLTVLPPWYRTWLAYFLYLSALVTSVYGYLYYHKKQTQLQYEVKLVKEVNEKKIAFFTNISHELRTPLTLIVNPIKELLHGNGANVDLVDISSVYRNSRRLLSLVDQLLLFRSSESEISDLKPELINLKEVCYEVFLCFNNQVKIKDITYSFFSEKDEVAVYCDREKIEIVFFNLLSNAIKYTPSHGKVSMDIRIEGDTVKIMVIDSGCGIPEEEGKKLFEKFYRVPQASASQSGFGIGLFLAKKYVDLHTGDLFFKSVLNEGTTFTVALPMADHHHDNIALTHVTSSGISATPMLQELMPDQEEVMIHDARDHNVQGIMSGIVDKRPVILLIDDDFEVRNYVKNLLKGSYTILEADSAESGLEITLEYEPDVIVCDVIMKGMSGVDFCSKMKESPSFNHIPIILLTGTSSPEIKLKGIECGADDYITKPFESDLLIARIKSVLKRTNTLKNYFFNEVTLKNNSQKIPAEYSEFLEKCIKIIENNLEDEDFDLKKFTSEIGMSRANLFRKIKSISGLSSTEFIRNIRMKKAAELMIQTDLQIKEIAFRVGFLDIKHFREQFHKLFEMNPSDFVKKYRKNFSQNVNLNNSITKPRNRT